MKLPQIEIAVRFKGARKTDLKTITCSSDMEQVVRELFNADTVDWVEEMVAWSASTAPTR